MSVGGPESVSRADDLMGAHSPPAGPARQRVWRHWSIVLLGLLLPALWLYGTRLAPPSDATLMPPTPGRSVARIEQVYDPSSALRPDDEVVAVNAIPVDDWVAGRHPALDVTLGQTLTYQVRRPGVAELILIPVQLRPYPLAQVALTNAPLVLVVVGLLALFAGVYVARPRDPASVPIMIVGLSLPWVVTEFPIGPQVIDLVRGGGFVSYVVADVAACLMWAAIAHVALVFPSPLSILGRQRWLVPACYLAPFVLYAVSLSWRLPQASSEVEKFFGVLVLSSLAASVLSVFPVVRLLVSYRRTTDMDQSRSLRWIGFAVGFFVLSYLLCAQLFDVIRGHPLIPLQWLMLTALPIPLTFAAAILRHRLFDIEVVLTRSLIVGLLTTAIVALYALAVLLLPTLKLFGPLSTLTALIVGGGITALALGLRKRLSRRVTALVYGHRSNPHAVIEQLGRIGSASDTEQLLPELVRTLSAALRLSYVRLELRGPDGSVESTAQVGLSSGPRTVVPIGTDTEVFGTLELDPGRRREPFGPADRRLLDDITRQLADTCRTVLLARALQRSRARIIVAREEERRRLRRDLHDGVGPTLAAMAMQLEVAESEVSTAPQLARHSVARVADAAHELLNEIRGIVDGLRPAALDQVGLVEAIRESVAGFERTGGHTFAVDLRSDGVGLLPAAVEVAALRIAVEAVNNAARYSGGHRCTVSLSAGDELGMEVADDGDGLRAEVLGSGVGLASMRERAAELSGECTITNRSDRSGTIVRLVIPLRGGH